MNSSVSNINVFLPTTTVNPRTNNAPIPIVHNNISQPTNELHPIESVSFYATMQMQPR